MVPWYLIPITAIASGVLMVIFMPKYNAFAEFLELMTAKDFQAIADWAQAKANALKAPGK